MFRNHKENKIHLHCYDYYKTTLNHVINHDFDLLTGMSLIEINRLRHLICALRADMPQLNEGALSGDSVAKSIFLTIREFDRDSSPHAFLKDMQSYVLGFALKNLLEERYLPTVRQWLDDYVLNNESKYEKKDNTVSQSTMTSIKF